MNDKKIKKYSKFLSLVLRHKPEEIGIILNSAGWTSVSGLLKAVNSHGMAMTSDQLKSIVKDNDKKRFSFNEDSTMIRANQGHSVKVELEYSAVEPHSPLYHGTVTDFLDSIYKDGIQKMKRHHVHLSGDFSTAVKVAKRRGGCTVVILIIDTKQMYDDGHTFYVSDNGVWLTDHIPPKYISGVKYPHV